MPPLEPTPEDRRQALLDEPQPGDDDVIGLTRRQAIKLAAILDAHARTDGASGAGESLWADALLDGRDLLLAHAYDDRRPAPGIPAVAEAVRRLSAWPWPSPMRPNR